MEATPFGPMVESASPALLKDLLEQYGQLIEAAGVPMNRWLMPGVSAGLIERELADVGLPCPEELIVWFGWHNGRNAALPRGLTAHAMPNFDPLSIQEATRGYFRDVLHFEKPPTTSLPVEAFQFGVTRGWMRLQGSVYGCAVYCDGPHGQPPRLRSANEFFGDPDAEGLFEAVSLCTLVTWWIESINNGAFDWDKKEGRWRVTHELLPSSQRAVLFT